MNSPTVSIVMSSYNGEKYIKDTIESVIAQTYRDWEFIIYDDCSTDNTREIIQSFKDKRIKTYFPDTHEHMVVGFNYGITHSTGAYIARIDNDDTWEPEKLQKQVDFFQSHPEFGACFTLVTMKDETGKVLTEKDSARVSWFNTRNKSQAEWLRFFYFKGSCLCHTSVMMTRKAIERVGLYNLAYIQLQDYDLWVRITKCFPIHVLQEKLTNYRWFTSGTNVSSATQTTVRRSNFEFSQILSKYFDDIPDDLFSEAFGNDFVHKGTTDPDELKVERMMLLFKPVFCGLIPELGGTQKFISYLQDEKMRNVLREKYDMTQLLLYQITGKPMLYEEVSPSYIPTPYSGPRITRLRQLLSWLKRRFI